jgi:hypothetical protein
MLFLNSDVEPNPNCTHLRGGMTIIIRRHTTYTTVIQNRIKMQNQIIKNIFSVISFRGSWHIELNVTTFTDELYLK